MVDDVEPQDEVMDLFRKHFHLVANCNVDADGKKMTYRLKTEAFASTWEANANKIIKALNLQLVAKVDVWKAGSVVFEVSLHIIYKP